MNKNLPFRNYWMIFLIFLLVSFNNIFRENNFSGESELMRVRGFQISHSRVWCINGFSSTSWTLCYTWPNPTYPNLTSKQFKNILRTTGDNNQVRYQNPQLDCPASNDVSHDEVNHPRRELFRSVQGRVGSDLVWH